MPRFSANLTFLYSELAFLDRFAAAARDGFAAVEYAWAYDHAPEVLAASLARHGLTQVLFNLPPGNAAAGERGIACLPDRVEEFRASVDTAIRYARATNCTLVNCLAGIAPPGVARERLEATLVDNLRYAAPRLADAGVRLVVEPINTRDIPGFFLNTTHDFERIAAAANVDNLYLQFDFYHAQVMQGDLIRTFERLRSRILHVQIADNPGRRTPGTGEINLANVFAAIDRSGYDGWVGAEYRPDGDTTASLQWLRDWNAATHPKLNGF